MSDEYDGELTLAFTGDDQGLVYGLLRAAVESATSQYKVMRKEGKKVRLVTNTITVSRTAGGEDD